MQNHGLAEKIVCRCLDISVLSVVELEKFSLMVVI